MKFETSKMYIKKLEIISIETVIFLRIKPEELEFLWENKIFMVSNSKIQFDCYIVHNNPNNQEDGFFVPKDWFTFKNPKFGKNGKITRIKPFDDGAFQPIAQESSTNEKQKEKNLDLEKQIKEKQEILADKKKKILGLKKEKSALQQAGYDLTHAIKKKNKELKTETHTITEVIPEESKQEERPSPPDAIVKYHEREVELLEDTIDILKKCLFERGDKIEKSDK